APSGAASRVLPSSMPLLTELNRTLWLAYYKYAAPGGAALLWIALSKSELLEGEGSTRIARISTNFPQSERPAEVVQIREIRVEQCVHRDSIEQSHSMDRDRPNECSD